MIRRHRQSQESRSESNHGQEEVEIEAVIDQPVPRELTPEPIAENTAETVAKPARRVKFAPEVEVREEERSQERKQKRFEKSQKVIEEALANDNFDQDINSYLSHTSAEDLCELIEYVKATYIQEEIDQKLAGFTYWAPAHTCYQYLLEKTLSLQWPEAKEKFVQVVTDKYTARDFIKTSPMLVEACGEDFKVVANEFLKRGSSVWGLLF
ncbi:MAG: hypothetical protein ACR2PX_07705 [Endozoicomonas sp.]|uniref:hypothetical protein n=1 Tax=Endozoicomonas sp. TaxID=1892382 RepID=UPI003D9ADF0F